MTTKIAKNGRKLVPHDEATAWSVCGDCGRTIDWSSDALFGPGNFASEEEWEASRDDTTCPYCGGTDTAWLPDED